MVIILISLGLLFYFVNYWFLLVSYRLITGAAAAVVLANNDWLGAVNDGLRVVGRAHLLIGLHVHALRPGIHDRGARVVDRAGLHIRGNGVTRGAGGPAIVVVRAGAVTELETPGSGVSCGAESEGGGNRGKEDEFFHGCWWLNYEKILCEENDIVKSEVLISSVLRLVFKPLDGVFSPFGLRNRPLGRKMKIAVFIEEICPCIRRFKKSMDAKSRCASPWLPSARA